MSEIKVCDICNKRFEEFGNNPAPFRGERCCNECNNKLVIPLRIYQVTKDPTYALLFGVDGTVSAVKPKDEYFTLKELQGLVGGLIELYPQKIHGHFVVCNEEGLILDLEVNNVFRNYSNITLVGDVLLCPVKIFEEPEEEDYED